MNLFSAQVIRKKVEFAIVVFKHSREGYAGGILGPENKSVPKGVIVSQVSSEGSDSYRLVRCSDGAVACSFKLKAGERVLLNNDGLDIGYKRLQSDERVVSRATLVEMVKELTAKN